MVVADAGTVADGRSHEAVACYIGEVVSIVGHELEVERQLHLDERTCRDVVVDILVDILVH